MKKLVITLIAAAMSAVAVSAQDMSQATETAKNANEALGNKDYPAALAGFKEALTQAEACGDEGAELVSTCKDIIPTLVLNIAKGEIREKAYDKALETLAEALKVAEEYGHDDVLAEAATLVAGARKSKASDLYKAKDYAAAAAAFKEVLAADPEDGSSALQLAVCLNNTGDKDAAIAAFEQAAQFGQKANAYKQLANIYLKDAQALGKEKKFKEAIEACTKSNEYVESANAYKLAANYASQLKDNKTAIANYEKYLVVSPDAKDAGAINFTLGALYQQAGNNDKAKEFYTKAQSDPQYGPQAKQLLDALK